MKQFCKLENTNFQIIKTLQHAFFIKKNKNIKTFLHPWQRPKTIRARGQISVAKNHESKVLDGSMPVY